ncbi:MAG: S41 family peptidase [Clostridia bacterium]|nr:S41 family peptidase [Clostridia bacterium]
MEEEKLKKESIYKKIMLVAVTAFITFILTTFLLYRYLPDSFGGPLTDSGDNVSVSSYLNKIRKAVDKYYLWTDKINEEDLQDSAVEGYVSGLGDEYTEYIPKKEMEEYTETITGSFVGIGIYMIADAESDRIVVYYPIPESPAEKVGMKSGDKIIKVDGIEYTSKDFDKIADYIKGEEGTKVNIVVERDKKEISLDITRAKINTNPITIKLMENDIGYLNLPSFDDGTANDFKEKVEELKNKGAKSLIIDLRNDGGGIVDEATEIADYILEKGDTIISTVDNKGEKKVTHANKKPIFDLPIVILVNENTASASEILTAALKEHNKATVVGVKTYGKGVIQTLFTLSDGSGLKITTAEYYTPNGNTIHKQGIVPDEEVKLPDDVENIYAVKEKDDTQLKKAIEILKK